MELQFFLRLLFLLLQFHTAVQACMGVCVQLRRMLEEEEREDELQLRRRRRRRRRRNAALAVLHSLPPLRLQQASARRCWSLPASTEFWDVFVLGVWDDRRWLSNFRMSRQTFFEIVVILRPHLQRQDTNMRRAIPVEKRLAVAIWFLANTVTYRELANVFGLRTTTAAEIVVEVCLCIEMTLLKRTVYLGDHQEIMDGFAAMGMPHTIGAVDGTHIPLVNYRGRWRQFSNRKSYSSILLQGVADHRLQFINIETGWSGRNHDAFVFRNSDIYKAMDRGVFVPLNPTIQVEGVQVPPLILGDGGYPMDRWLMKAYTGRLDAKQTHFNRAFKCCRNVVERAFGHLKTRWRCLSSRLQVAEENVVPVITACVVLHNICEKRGHAVQYEPPPRCHPRQERAEDIDVEDMSRLDQGKRVRDALATFMYNVRP